MDPSRPSVAECLRSDDQGARAGTPDQPTALAEQLTDLAERYLAVTALPNSVEALWRGYHQQQRALLELAQLFDDQEKRYSQELARLRYRVHELESWRDTARGWLRRRFGGVS